VRTHGLFIQKRSIFFEGLIPLLNVQSFNESNDTQAGIVTAKKRLHLRHKMPRKAAGNLFAVRIKDSR
jgi:hypothetical protein